MAKRWHITTKMEVRICRAKTETSCPYYKNTLELMKGYPTHFDSELEATSVLDEILEERYIEEIENNTPENKDLENFNPNQFEEDLDEIMKNINYYNSYSHLEDNYDEDDNFSFLP